MTFPGKTTYNFNDLFIFDIANNHQGSVEHGLAIIRAMGDIVKRQDIRAAFKFQFRDLDTFIHPDYVNTTTNKHVPRFLSTRLTEEEYAVLIAEVNKQGMVTMATPFDEASVDMAERLDIEILKVASCSAMDWPLLERIAETGKPVVCSTGGLTLREVDKVISFFKHRGVNFSVEYCVSIYPTPNDKFYLQQIPKLINRYPGITIGFSTHESPENYQVIAMAYALGARTYEKHVGLETDTIQVNAYSAVPEQVEKWVRVYKQAVDIYGTQDEQIVSDKERSDLKSLMRGVFAKKDIPKGAEIKNSDVFFAIPIQQGQLPSGNFKPGMIADQNYQTHAPINEAVRDIRLTNKDIVYSTIHAVKGLLNEASIPLGHDFAVEISHHYGIERFFDIGCVLITVINREYAKKLIVQLPGQWHPVHYHKRKDETFQVLYGTLEVDIEGHHKVLHPGDTLWVPQGVWHAFGTKEGVIFEEISSRAYANDSFYVDRKIATLARDDRKTYLLNWGRHQFDD